MSFRLLVVLGLCSVFLIQCKKDKKDANSETSEFQLDSKKNFSIEWLKTAFKSGECIQVSVNVTDESGTPSPVSIPTQILSELDEKAKVYSDAACTLELPSIDLKAGDARFVLYYRTTGHGSLNIRFVSGEQSQEHQIEVSASRLDISISGGLTAGERKEIQVRATDESGEAAVLFAPKSVSLSGANFFATADSIPSLSQVTIPQGQSAVSLFAYHETAGNRTLSADAAELLSASSGVSVSAAAASKFVLMGDTSISAVDCESYQVRTTDAFGNAALPLGSTVISFSGEARFYADSNCTVPLTDAKRTLDVGNPNPTIYLIKGKSETFSLSADDSPSAGLAKASLSIDAVAGPATQIIVDMDRETVAYACKPVRVFPADREGNASRVAADKSFRVSFKAPVNETPESTQARFALDENCAGDQFVAFTGTFDPNDEEGTVYMIATEGSVVITISDLATVFPTVETAVTVNSNCGAERAIDFPEWNVSFVNGKLTVQGGAGTAFIRVGYSSQGNVYVMNQRPADDPTFSSAVRVFCVNEVDVRTGSGAKTVDMSLGYLNGVDTSGRLDGRVTVTLQGTGGQTIYGSEFDDVIIGTPGNDLIIAKGGSDVIDGNGGADIIYAGAGNDTINIGYSNGNPPTAVGDFIAYGGSGGDTFNIQTVNVTGNVTINGDGPDQP